MYRFSGFKLFVSVSTELHYLKLLDNIKILKVRLEGLKSASNNTSSHLDHKISEALSRDTS